MRYAVGTSTRIVQRPAAKMDVRCLAEHAVYEPEVMNAPTDRLDINAPGALLVAQQRDMRLEIVCFVYRAAKTALFQRHAERHP